jgi:hypothetical protein
MTEMEQARKAGGSGRAFNDCGVSGASSFEFGLIGRHGVQAYTVKSS